MNKVLIFAALFAAAIAHDVMTSPANRAGPTPSGAKPCGASNNLDVKILKSYTAGNSFTVTWQKNHAGSTSDIYLAPAAKTPTFTNKIASLKYDDGKGTVTIPSGTASGEYTLQWIWSGFYACTDFVVLPEGLVLPTTSKYANGTFTLDHGTYNPSDNTFDCEKGYKPKTVDGVKDCQKGGLSGGAGFGIFLLVVVVVVGGVAIGLFVLSKKKPETFDKITDPFTNLINKIRGK